MIEPDLRDKVALITGANHGIGAATARIFASEGAKVAIAYLDGASSTVTGVQEAKIAFFNPGVPYADAVVNEIRDAGGRAIAVPGDLSDVTTIPALFDRVEASLGNVDILINNAAHCEMPDDIHTTSSGSIDRHFAVNVRAAVLLVSEYVKRYRAREGTSGRVVNVSTDSAQSFAKQISYGASKSSMEAYTRSVALEVASYGITVNAVAPGPVHTGQPSYITPEAEKRLNRSIPLGRCGQPEDIANAITFLCSKQAEWITGQVIKVDGGHRIGSL